MLSGVVMGGVWLGSPCRAISAIFPRQGAASLCGRGAAIAQQLDPQLRENFLADPLTEDDRDPLLPVLGVDRAYSPLERQAIGRSLDQLNQLATQQLAEGNLDLAFETWQRELKLRRVLGTQAEFEAIQRVASLAWQEQRAVEVRLLTLRSREIWEAIQLSFGSPSETEFGEESPDADPEDSLISGAPTVDIATLTALAQTFETLRDIDSAVAVYQQLIADQRDARDGADCAADRSRGAAPRVVSVCAGSRCVFGAAE